MSKLFKCFAPTHPKKHALTQKFNIQSLLDSAKTEAQYQEILQHANLSQLTFTDLNLNFYLYAIQRGRLRFIQWLLTTHKQEDSSYLDAVDLHGNTALHIAVMTNQTEMVRAVFKNRETDVLKVNKLNETPLDLSKERSNDEIRAILMQKAEEDDEQSKEDEMDEQGQESIYEEVSIGELEEEPIGVVNSTEMHEKPENLVVVKGKIQTRIAEMMPMQGFKETRDRLELTPDVGGEGVANDLYQ
ncbi:hypothetical protein FGO68_gene117 [Halteria grandinella]|uniref:Ankyrin repeat domain-containing protein n=1 Tax=Halteria grandinella TaxID=5974 RepID=A0A8J8T8X3_HALGN|nr:hypothetical protein FGO68_gene117 [Halteria grandinella]